MPTEKKFVGPRLVTAVVIDDKVTTYSGAEVVTVNYDGGESELMSKQSYEIVATDEPSDYTTIRNKKFEAMYKDLYPIIAEYLLVVNGTVEEKKEARTALLQKAISTISEYDIKVSEIGSFLTPVLAELNGVANAIAYELDNTFNRAVNLLWTKNDKAFVPGTDPMMDRTLLEAKKIQSTNDRTETTTE